MEDLARIRPISRGSHPAIIIFSISLRFLFAGSCFAQSPIISSNISLATFYAFADHVALVEYDLMDGPSFPKLLRMYKGKLSRASMREADMNLDSLYERKASQGLPGVIRIPGPPPDSADMAQMRKHRKRCFLIFLARDDKGRLRHVGKQGMIGAFRAKRQPGGKICAQIPFDQLSEGYQPFTAQNGNVACIPEDALENRFRVFSKDTYLNAEARKLKEYSRTNPHAPKYRPVRQLQENIAELERELANMPEGKGRSKERIARHRQTKIKRLERLKRIRDSGILEMRLDSLKTEKRKAIQRGESKRSVLVEHLSDRIANLEKMLGMKNVRENRKKKKGL